MPPQRTAKPKKDEEAEHGIRPIAIGEALLKAACTVVIKDIDAPIKKAFDGIQFGVGAKGGTDFVVHSIWRNITCRKKKISVALDGSNAFNSPYRRKIKEVLLRPEFSELRPLWNLWNLAYSKPSNLHFRGDDGKTATILSQRGTRQGDVLGGLFFSIAIQPTLTAAKKMFPEIEILAYLDDITLQGDDPADMKACIEFIEAEFEKLGLRLNPEKCEWFSDEYPCPFPQWLKPKKFIKILGSFFGTDMQAVADALTAHSKKKHRLFFDRLAILPFNAQVIILSNCGIPRMNYTVRAQRPDLTKEACEDFDRRVELCWSTLAEVENTERTRAIASLPTSLGGCGFTCFTNIRQPSYEASRSTAFAEQGAMSQRSACNAVHRTVYDRLAASSHIMKLHLYDAAQKSTSTWLRVTYRETLVPDKIISAALRIRLNTTHKLVADFSCPGCPTSNLDHETWTQHVAGCARVKGLNASAAHAALKISLAGIVAERSILQESKEPEGYAKVVCPTCKMKINFADIATHAQAKKCDTALLQSVHVQRPDKRIMFRDRDAVVDVTLVAICTPSAPKQPSEKPLAFALDARDKKKYDNYKAAAEANGDNFFCLAMTRVGSMNDDTKALAVKIHKNSLLHLDSVKLIMSELSAAAIFSSAISLINAERQKDVSHRRRATRTEEEDAEEHHADLHLDAHIKSNQTRDEHLAARFPGTFPAATAT